MKRWIKHFVIAAIMIILSVAVIGILKAPDYNTFKLSPLVCKYMLKVTPEEFVDCSGEGTKIAYGYTYAKVDRNGNLFLVLTDEELSYWKNSRFDLQVLQKVIGEERSIGIDIIPPQDSISKIFYDDADTACGFEISNDYTKIIAGPGDDKSYFALIPSACIAVQFFDGKPSDEIKVEYIEVNESQEVINMFTWPDDYAESQGDLFEQ